MALYRLVDLPDKNGDKMYFVYVMNAGAKWPNYCVRCVGTVRYIPRTGDYHAVTNRRGKIVSRYYGTVAGCVGWLKRQHGI